VLERQTSGVGSSFMKPMVTIDFHHKAYVCSHVFDGASPVMLVSRPDGDWCFLCGQLHDESGVEYKVVGIGHLLAEDKSLAELTDLPPDWEAERTEAGGNWIRTRFAPDG
jgi:hypothetical protein